MDLLTRPRAPPELVFPPRSRYANIPSTALRLQRQPEMEKPKVPRALPNFGFKFHPTSTTTIVPQAEIKTQSTSQSSSPLSTTTTATPCLFLNIPLEIRLQIYDYVLHSSRIHHAHLAPLAREQPTSSSGMNTEEFHTVMIRPSYITNPKSLSGNPRFRKEDRRCIVERTGTGEVKEWPLNATGHGNGCGNREREVRGKIPTGLLASCKQIYEETHRMPFETNTFTFINWFWSGIYAAKQFTENLGSWQKESLRWVGIEVLGGDLWVDRAVGGNLSKGKGLREWIELCELWKGNVRGMRVCIKGGLVVDRKKKTEEPQEVSDEQDDKATSKPNTILDNTAEWVTQGLCTLASLRKLELEIEDEDISRADKLAFCADLALLLNASQSTQTSEIKTLHARRQRSVQVIFRDEIEVPKEEVPNKDFTWYGGEPGDEMIWGNGY